MRTTSRYDVSQRKRRNVPQEVFMGYPLGGAPHKNAACQSHYSRQEYRKARKCANTSPAWA